MPDFDYLVTCSGWEDRFTEGLEHNIAKFNIDEVVVFNIDKFLDKTQKNRMEAIHKLKDINYSEVEISLVDDVKTWRTIEQFFNTNQIDRKNICVDITTMPRFLIWFFMHFVSRYNNCAKYVYYKPNKYEECDWLTSDAEQPRLVFKHSGIYLSDRPTLLVVQTGFDIERVNQLIYSYEPERVFLGAQIGDQFDNLVKNLHKHKEHLKFQEIEYFEIDAFNAPYGYEVMKEIVVKYSETHNIILSSFGPKPAAVAMFNLNGDIPEVGLSYVLVKNYNEAYSHGTNIDDQIVV